jgi:hypothetical protein
MNKKVVLFLCERCYWCVGIVGIYVDCKIKSMHKINKFYKVSDDFIYIYHTIGGSGTGWREGDLKEKIKLTDSEFETRTDVDISLNEIPGHYE